MRVPPSFSIQTGHVSDNNEVQDAFFRTHHPIMGLQAGLTVSERRFHAVPDDE